ncbi:unnamed protein product [Bemisia tabaci]|uniref:Uncharacterized protein n=1 Tax=Bemisia tabaci TaxID=7038 RepID=A0A9P0F2A2_BEMTA|nr:unnamed protein product [Bemisia tabaci]
MPRTVILICFLMICVRLTAETSVEEDYWSREDLFDKQYPMITSNITLHFRQNVTGNHSGCYLWDSSRELADYLERSCLKNNWIRGKNVLELGAGLGCAGVATACLGGNVTLTDLPEMLPYMQDSINRNIDNIEKTAGKIRAEILYWTDKKKIRSMSRYDVILLSDVIYDEDYAVHPLISLLVRLSHENTTLLICQERWLKETRRDAVWQKFVHHASKCFKFSELRAKGRFVKDPGDVWLLEGKVLKIV